ncbi:hypothetical protein HK405_001500, partial [Cladochytrium tenue]
GSHDHRGTPAAPGRVVTLLPADEWRERWASLDDRGGNRRPNEAGEDQDEEDTWGVAYRVPAALAESVKDHLDFREKNGYRALSVDVLPPPLQPATLLGADAAPPSPPQPIVRNATAYVAAPDNPAFLGPAPAPDLAAHIAAARGPSGSNVEYLLALALSVFLIAPPPPSRRDVDGETWRLDVVADPLPALLRLSCKNDSTAASNCCGCCASRPAVPPDVHLAALLGHLPNAPTAFSPAPTDTTTTTHAAPHASCHHLLLRDTVLRARLQRVAADLHALAAAGPAGLACPAAEAAAGWDGVHARLAHERDADRRRAAELLAADGLRASGSAAEAVVAAVDEGEVGAAVDEVEGTEEEERVEAAVTAVEKVE